MIDFSILNLDNLGEWYLLANTPDYLLKHFTKDKSIKELSKSDAKELIENYRNLEELYPDVDTKMRISAYALLSSLTLKDYKDVLPFFEELSENSGPYTWARNIARHYLATVKITKVIRRDLGSEEFPNDPDIKILIS